jgi:hypothetical protein
MFALPSSLQVELDCSFDQRGFVTAPSSAVIAPSRAPLANRVFSPRSAYPEH